MILTVLNEDQSLEKYSLDSYDKQLFLCKHLGEYIKHEIVGRITIFSSQSDHGLILNKWTSKIGKQFYGKMVVLFDDHGFDQKEFDRVFKY
jgi:hypothetical protein